MTNEELVQLEREVLQLRTLYDNYFLGIERREPLRLREALVAKIRDLTASGQAGNTQMLFRWNNFKAKFASLQSHWNRVAKQLEEGTYKRGSKSSAPPSAPLTKAVEKKPADPLDDQTMRALHANYLAARQKSGEAPISYESMVASLRKQVPAVVDRYKCKSVEFKVSQKDGKTVIRAVPVN